MDSLNFHHEWREGASERTLLLLHGTGGNERDLLPLGRTLDPAANLLSPRGHVSEGGMNRFFRRFEEGVFDEESIRTESAALATFVAAASTEYGFDAGKVFAVGFSNGANIGASTMLLHPSVLAGGVLIRAMVPLVPDVMPDLDGKRVFLSSGESDPIVPRENVLRLASMLEEAGAEVRHLWVPTGHNLAREEVFEATAWLRGIPV